MSADTLSRPRVLLIGIGPTSRTALDGLADDLEVIGLARDGDDDTTARP